MTPPSPARRHRTGSSPSYWYPRDGWGEAETLDAVRRFLRADEAMRRKLQRDMDMNETDLHAVRFLAAAERDGRAVAPRDLSRELGISTASTTKLLDRLERAGRLRRVQHPTDRRGLRIELTPHVHTEVHDTLGAMHARMRDVAGALGPAESSAVVAFLDALSEAVRPDDGDEPAPDVSARGGASRRGSRPGPPAAAT